jgi:hypothetical protein
MEDQLVFELLPNHRVVILRLVLCFERLYFVTEEEYLENVL